MIFGSITVSDKAVSTHRDSYLLDKITVVSVRRPLLAPTILMGGGSAAFGLAFADLLYAGEQVAIGAAVLLMGVSGSQAGQLKLLSREIGTSPLGDVIWGRYKTLNKIRLQIAGKLQQVRQGSDA